MASTTGSAALADYKSVRSWEIQMMVVCHDARRNHACSKNPEHLTNSPNQSLYVLACATGSSINHAHPPQKGSSSLIQKGKQDQFIALTCRVPEKDAPA